MGLQTISSGAFSFQRTADNRTRTAIAGTMNISVDNNNDISGDFRVHDAETPGGLPTPPAGTLSYMLTEKAIFTEEFVATANNQAHFAANTTLYAPFETEDNVRVYINDQEIRPFYAAFTIDYAASSITITDSKFTDLITQDAKGNYGLRFPRCKRIRHDKFVADINTIESVSAGSTSSAVETATNASTCCSKTSISSAAKAAGLYS